MSGKVLNDLLLDIKLFLKFHSCNIAVIWATVLLISFETTFGFFNALLFLIHAVILQV